MKARSVLEDLKKMHGGGGAWKKIAREGTRGSV